MRAKFGVLKQTERLHLRAKFHLNMFIESASGGQKPEFWANFDFWGLLYRPPFTNEGQIWYNAIADPQSTCVKIALDRFILSPYDGKKPNFCRFVDFGI